MESGRGNRAKAKQTIQRYSKQKTYTYIIIRKTPKEKVDNIIYTYFYKPIY